MSAEAQRRSPSPAWPSLEADETLRVHAEAEIVHLLKKVMSRAAVVAAHFRNGDEFALTTIMGVSERDGVVFLEPGPDRRTNKRLLDANDILLVTHEGQVKIKFTADRVDEVDYMGVRAFRIAMPPFIVRLQRREFFRIPTSILNPVLCCFRLDDGTEATAVLSDISVGGVCLVDDQNTLQFRRGDRYEHCYIDLPGHGTVEMGLEVRNVADTKKVRNSKIVRRAGCKFFKLSRFGENVVQRYIMSLEMAQDLRQGRRIMVKR